MSYRRRMVLGAVALATLVGLGGLALANYRFARMNPGGSDFLPGWVATRLMLVRGWSPYGEQTKAEIQQAFYGGDAPAGGEILFVYPIYIIGLLAPFALVKDYELARALWMTCLEASLCATAVLSVTLVRWRVRAPLLLGLLAFSLLWYHAMRSVINGNVVVVSGLFLLAALAMIRADKDVSAGLFLALAMVKPNVVLLLFVFVVLWALSRRRWRLVLAPLGFLCLLTVGGMLILPDWPIQNLRQISAYAAIPLPGSPSEVLSSWFPAWGARLGWALSLTLAVALVLEWRAAWGKGFGWFLWTASLTLVINQWIGIKTDPGNFVILVPALVLVFGAWVERWGKVGEWATGLSLLFLGIGLWALFLATLKYGDQPQQSPLLFFPLPLFVLGALYSIRSQLASNRRSPCEPLPNGPAG